MAWAAVAGAAGSVIAGGLSMSSGSKAAKDAKKDAKIRRSIALNAFSPIDFFGPGGASVTFGGSPGGTGSAPTGVASSTANLSEPGTPFGYDPSTGIHYDGKGNPLPPGQRQIPGTRGLTGSDLGSINTSAGDLEGIRSGLVGLAGGSAQQAAQAQGMDPFVQQAFANFLNQGQQGQGTLNQLLQGTGALFGQVGQQASDQFTNPFAQGLQQQVMGQAQNAFGALPGTQEASRDQMLSLLRDQARPEEDRLIAGNLDNLFATGRLGTTGGALQTEAFARGLGQADLQRQIMAGQEGRNAQQAQLGLGQTLAGTGSGLAGLQDQLLSGATNRFNQVSGLANLLQGQGFSQAQQTLGQSNAPNVLNNQNQSLALQNLLAALGGATSVNQDARENASLVGSFMTNQASTRMGASGIGMPQDNSTATALAQLSGALAPQGGIGSAFSALANRFGGSPTGSPTGVASILTPNTPSINSNAGNVSASFL